MIISDRDEQIYKLRNDGISNSEIARTFDISSNRVRQIFIRVDDYKNKYPPFRKLLPIRVHNILIAHFKDESIFERPEDIISSIKYKDLFKIRNAGVFFLRDIRNALVILGYIKPDDNWFKYY